ncbi:MAG: peptidoglycan-binding domain-containing protein, partial [Mycobacteriales bacterium]
MRTRCWRDWALVVVTAAALLATVLGVPASAAPATPVGLTSAIEAYQPYVGQSLCDPVAKPGVRAFMNLLIETYPDTGSDGIVRDCGTGGQSEHKEGRAFDWEVSASNPTDVTHVNDLLAWLLATDRYGNTNAMFRRLGLMYMIWNNRIWKGYQADRGWQPYSGASEHTDHVHFSFGWAGAKQATSYWTGRVAPIDYGPGKAPALPTVTPVARPANLPVLASYGSTTLTPSSSGAAVAALQTGLQRTATGTWTSDTTSAVQQFQRQQGLAVSSSWTPDNWLRLFPKPTVPFGAIEHVDPARGPMNLTGWAIDAGA